MNNPANSPNGHRDSSPNGECQGTLTNQPEEESQRTMLGGPKCPF